MNIPRNAALMLMLMTNATAAFAASADHEDMRRLAAQAGCLTCHSIEAGDGKEPVGPAWSDVARQYRGQKAAVDNLTRAVQQGTNPYQSHWKNKVTGLAMPPNAVAISEADTRRLVSWILSLGQ